MSDDPMIDPPDDLVIEHAERLSHWNYRVVRTAEMYAIYEVYYTEAGVPKFRTVDQASPQGDTLAELRHDLLHYQRAIYEPVLDDAIFQGTTDPAA